MAKSEKKCVHDSCLCRNVRWFLFLAAPCMISNKEKNSPYTTVSPMCGVLCVSVCGRFSYIDHRSPLHCIPFRLHHPGFLCIKQPYPEIPKWFIQKVQFHHRWIPSKIDEYQHFIQHPPCQHKNRQLNKFMKFHWFLSLNVQKIGEKTSTSSAASSESTMQLDVVESDFKRGQIIERM